MKEFIDLSFVLSKDDILEQIKTKTNIPENDPRFVYPLVDEIHKTLIDLKLSCELHPDGEVDVEIVTIQGNVIIKDSGILLKNGYVKHE